MLNEVDVEQEIIKAQQRKLEQESAEQRVNQRVEQMEVDEQGISSHDQGISPSQSAINTEIQQNEIIVKEGLRQIELLISDIEELHYRKGIPVEIQSNVTRFVKKNLRKAFKDFNFPKIEQALQLSKIIIQQMASWNNSKRTVYHLQPSTPLTSKYSQELRTRKITTHERNLLRGNRAKSVKIINYREDPSLYSIARWL